MLKAAGFSDADLRKPLIGVANTWIEIGPCNYTCARSPSDVKDGIRAAGGTPMEFNTVSISDGITMGTEGMRASLVSREVIADSIELVARGNGFDGLVVLVGCDKTIPGGVMALARLNMPGLVLYGGSIAPGQFQGREVTIQDVFEAVGAHAAGRMTDEDFKRSRTSRAPAPARAAASSRRTRWRSSARRSASPRSAAAACRPPIRRRPTSARAVGEQAVTLAAGGLRPRDDHHARARSRTRSPSSRRPADRPTPCCTCWRSRREAGVELDARRLRSHQREDAAHRRPQAVGPLRRDRSARGRRQPAGGQAADRSRARSPATRRRSPAGRWPRKRRRPSETPGQEVVRPIDRPLKPHGGLVILFGNLAPEGGVLKLSGTERAQHRGPARVFDSEEAAFEAVQQQAIKAGRRRRDPLRRAGRRPGHARDARRDRGHRRRRPGRLGGAAHRRPLLGRDARLHGRPRRRRRRRAAARSRRSATATSIVIDVANRRLDVELSDARDQGAAGVVDGARAALSDRRAGEVRAAGVVGVDRSGDGIEHGRRGVAADRRTLVSGHADECLRLERAPRVVVRWSRELMEQRETLDRRADSLGLPRARGRERRVRLSRAARSCRRTTRCSTIRSATSSCGTSRAPRTWPTATRARPARSASPSRRPAPAPPTWSPASPRR